MRRLIVQSVIQVIGGIWMPYGARAAMEYKIRIEDLNKDDDESWRDAVERWTTTHCGDFSSVDDFYAELELDTGTVKIPWSKGEDSELAFSECMFGEPA
jgi:hypothetical protein